MKLAHIVPISLLDCIPQAQHTHLVLSSLVLSNERYYQFYRDKRDSGDRIILDNPVHENRTVMITHWLEAVERVLPDVAVIPDVIDSNAKTLENVERALKEFEARKFSGVELMAVPHGRSQDDWFACARSLASTSELAWLGISLERRLNNDQYALVRRRERVEMLRTHSELFDRMKLHLLGISESAEELGDDRIWQRATSADTSKFAVWSMANVNVVPPVPVTNSYPGRAIFGGGYAYFFAPHTEGLSRRRMRRNLTRWSEYAEREID